jgi:GNAT superfamily N-acetyltransferase
LIRPVSYTDILAAKTLLHEYAQECSIPELGYAYPQPELYALLESSADFQVFGVYDGEVMVGFAAVLIYPLPHYGHKVAATESIFILREHRTKGADLMAFLEDYARQRECMAFLYSAPVNSQFDRMLTASKGYRHTNNVHLRKLA